LPLIIYLVISLVHTTFIFFQSNAKPEVQDSGISQAPIHLLHLCLAVFLSLYSVYKNSIFRHKTQPRCCNWVIGIQHFSQVAANCHTTVYMRI